jgi:hypothetical protein
VTARIVTGGPWPARQDRRGNEIDAQVGALS